MTYPCLAEIEPNFFFSFDPRENRTTKTTLFQSIQNVSMRFFQAPCAENADRSTIQNLNCNAATPDQSAAFKSKTSSRSSGQALSNTITFTHDVSAFVQSGSSTFVVNTGPKASISNALSVHLSYTVERDTDPPAGAVKTDTLSRITVI